MQRQALFKENNLIKIFKKKKKGRTSLSFCSCLEEWPREGKEAMPFIRHMMNKPPERWTWNFREGIRKPKVLEKAHLALASKRKRDKRNSYFLVRTWKNKVRKRQP